MAVDYGAGTSGAIASQYADLRSALAGKGKAEAAKEQRDIDRKGLFGTGITQDRLQGLADTGLGIAEWGDKRMAGQMERAEKSFGRRQAADERRLATLQARHDKGQLDKAGMDELDGLQLGMTERRTAFEDKYSKYGSRGLWDTGFGSEGVGWSDPGESKYSKAARERERGYKIGEVPFSEFTGKTGPDSLDPSGRRTPKPDAPRKLGIRGLGGNRGDDSGRTGGEPRRVSDIEVPSRMEPSPQLSSQPIMSNSTGSDSLDPDRNLNRGTGSAIADSLKARDLKEQLMSGGRNDSFKDRFRAERKIRGPGKVFKWNDNRYTTDYK